jgi:hypothetical protein
MPDAACCSCLKIVARAAAPLSIAVSLCMRGYVCLQDAWCVQERLGGQDMLLFGVFDGHGQEGKVVSHTICQNLPKIMARMVGSKVSAARSLRDVCCRMALHVILLAEEDCTCCLYGNGSGRALVLMQVQVDGVHLLQPSVKMHIQTYSRMTTALLCACFAMSHKKASCKHSYACACYRR